MCVAIVLEGLASERGRGAEADGALERLRAELVLDRADADEVLSAQRRIGDDYSRLVTWLGSPATMPDDSVDAALERLGLSNPTAYPRKGAWTSLSATGLLSATGRGSRSTRPRTQLASEGTPFLPHTLSEPGAGVANAMTTTYDWS